MTTLLQRYDRGDIRQLNSLSVLHLLRLKGPLSRAQIALELGLTRATVSKIALDLLDASLIEETHFTEGMAGRPGMLLNLNAGYGCLLAVEIDLNQATVAMGDFGQKIFWSETLPLSRSASSRESLTAIGKLLDAALKLAAERHLRCLGIGVAWAGLVEHQQGRLVYGPSSGWKDIPLKALWEARFGVPVYVENEANAGAVAWHHAKHQGIGGDLIYLSLGAGMAAGILIGGNLLRGQFGFAGQVGHVHFADNGVVCHCGRTGCWVTEVGVNAIRRKLEARGVDLPDWHPSEGRWLDYLFAKAESGDPAFREVLCEVAHQLGRGAASLVQTLNPATLVIGGHLGKLLSLVEHEIEAALAEVLLPGMLETLVLQVSDSGKDPLRGSLATVFDAALTTPFLSRAATEPAQG